MAIVNKSRRTTLIAAFYMSLPAFVTGLNPAFADMGLSPLRHVLDADNPAAEFIVSNPSDRMMEGRVSWIDLKATPTGYASATTQQRAALSAAPYLLVSPAQFRLEPGARIAISVRLKNGAGLPKGERRSHLLIETEASRTPIRKASNTGLQVDVGLGVSAPVIIRNGGSAKAKITDTKLYREEDGMLALETSIDPGGNNSSFGRMVVSFKPNDGGGAQTLGIRENVNGFTDADMRKVSIPFGFLSLGAGELTVRYEGAGEYEGILFDKRAYEIAPPAKDDASNGDAKN